MIFKAIEFKVSGRSNRCSLVSDRDHIPESWISPKDGPYRGFNKLHKKVILYCGKLSINGKNLVLALYWGQWYTKLFSHFTHSFMRMLYAIKLLESRLWCHVPLHSFQDWRISPVRKKPCFKPLKHTGNSKWKTPTKSCGQ